MRNEKYAIWYSLSTDYNSIMENFIARDNRCKFERDFHLKNRFVNYEDAIIIWYGKEQGELGGCLVKIIKFWKKVSTL